MGELDKLFTAGINDCSDREAGMVPSEGSPQSCSDALRTPFLLRLASLYVSSENQWSGFILINPALNCIVLTNMVWILVLYSIIHPLLAPAFFPPLACPRSALQSWTSHSSTYFKLFFLIFSIFSNISLWLPCILFDPLQVASIRQWWHRWTMTMRVLQ